MTGPVDRRRRLRAAHPPTPEGAGKRYEPDDNSRWITLIGAIREASGVGVKPMLSELPEAIAAVRIRAETAERLLAAATQRLAEYNQLREQAEAREAELRATLAHPLLQTGLALIKSCAVRDARSPPPDGGAGR